MGGLCSLHSAPCSDFFRELSVVNAEALKAGISLGKLLALDAPEISFLKLVLWIRAVIVLPIYWLFFSKHSCFRPVSICLLLGVWPAIVLAGLYNPFPGLGSLLIQGFWEWGVPCAVWVTYLQRSKRVRVTFEHSVKADQGDVSSLMNDVLQDASATDANAEKQDRRVDAHTPITNREPVGNPHFKHKTSEMRMQGTSSGILDEMSFPSANREFTLS